jgi:hypothetical protein
LVEFVRSNHQSPFFYLKENTHAPAFVKTLSNVEIDENFSADFGVQVAAAGDPHVEWAHNGTVLKDGPNIQVTSIRDLLNKKKYIFFYLFSQI